MYKQEYVKSISNTDSPYTLEVLPRTILVDTSGGDVTITLPAVATLGIVFMTKIVHVTGGGTLTINPDGADTYNDGQTSYSSDTAGEVIDIKTVAANRIDLKSNVVSVTKNAYEEKEVQFASDLDTVREVTMIGVLNVSAIVVTAGIDTDGVDIETSTDDGATWTARADIAALNTFIGASISGNYLSGTKWRLRLTANYESGVTNLQSATIIYTR
jgi:hypothetical protein